MAEKGGDLACENTINQDNTTVNSIALGKDLSATLTQDASITAAALSMITSMAANMQQEGQLTGPMQMTMNLAASMVQEGQINAALGLIAWCSTNMAQTADMSASNLRGTLSMEASIVSYTEFTAENVRDKVWQALLANYQGDGSAGKALAAAGSGGVDYAALANAVWTHLSRTLTEGAAPTPEDIAAAILSAAQVTPIHSDTKLMNGSTVYGDGTTGNKWRGNV
jgi:hypothetical protein